MGRIFLYVHDLRASGVVRNALAYARRLAEARHDTTLIADSGEGLWREAAEAGPFACALLTETESGRPGLAAAWRLRRWLARQPPGPVVSLGNHGHRTVWLATRGLARPRLYRISNAVAKGDGWRDRTRAAWMRLLAADAERLILVGASFADHPVLARALVEGRAVAIPNGVDIPRARRLAAAPCPHPWLEGGIPVVLGIGRLRPQKNFGVLVEAVARASRPMRLVLLGSGTEEERGRLQAQARDRGIELLLAGETDNVFAWLSRAAVFALPSRYEGSSMALLEAMAVGVPVIASRVAGDAAQVLDNGRYGLLVSPDDADGLAAALERQISDERILPGDRIDLFSAEATLGAYVRALAIHSTSRRT